MRYIDNNAVGSVLTEKKRQYLEKYTIVSLTE